ncbi:MULTISPECIES: DUF6344 domain-containing protein [Streptomyces]|uniref:DUF6344 domain-containing protein n=1 Tax=Streptomyces TaxID=1883 RepID=UPI0029AAD048|nr:DUF6344 domain-containing protein [Streptomyces sp. WI03-4A]MDX2597115.1 DUF6344 domain-containing protein [Streptomyces sp. WI03-4A]
MTGNNKVAQLWTAIVTAFLALCTALGLATATTAAAQTEAPATGAETQTQTAPTIPLMNHWAWSHGRALPPTMKQRIRAEAHGKSPSCRHRPLDETEAETDTAPQTTAQLDC